jgi:hypothetical protein
VIKTVDGGATWTACDMADHATLLVDVFFRDERRGTPAPPAADRPRGAVGGPAHLVRSSGGCDHPDCVVPLCRLHHRRYDRGRLDMLPYLEPRFRTELQHGLGHLGLLGLLRRVTSVRWSAVLELTEARRRAA